MDKIRKVFNKPRKTLTRPLTEGKHGAPHDFTVIMETLDSVPCRLDALLSDVREIRRQKQGICDVRVEAGPSNTESDDSICHIFASPGQQCLLKAGTSSSLPSSPQRGTRVRPACSLPASPLPAGRRRSPAFSSPSSPRISRLWVEEALQRSKGLPHSYPPTPQKSPQPVRQDGGRSGQKLGEGETDEEELQPTRTAGIRLSDTVIFRPKTSRSICGGEGEDGPQLRCLDWDRWTYCLLTPCVCLRCPSAPPYEAERFSEFQSISAFHCDSEKHSGAHIQRRDSKLSEIKPSLYPSLSLWMSTPLGAES